MPGSPLASEWSSNLGFMLKLYLNILFYFLLSSLRSWPHPSQNPFVSTIPYLLLFLSICVTAHCFSLVHANPIVWNYSSLPFLCLLHTVAPISSNFLKPSSIPGEFASSQLRVETRTWFSRPSLHVIWWRQLALSISHSDLESLGTWDTKLFAGCLFNRWLQLLTPSSMRKDVPFEWQKI